MSTFLRNLLSTACPRAASASALWDKLETHAKVDGIGQLLGQPSLLLHLGAFPERSCRRVTMYVKNRICYIANRCGLLSLNVVQYTNFQCMMERTGHFHFSFMANEKMQVLLFCTRRFCKLKNESVENSSQGVVVCTTTWTMRCMMKFRDFTS